VADSLPFHDPVAAIIMAAGRGSRMSAESGSKTLLPLMPEARDPARRRPLLMEILDSLPPGPRGLVVHHCKQDVMAATGHLPLTYIDQPVLNGTGGAILAAADFIRQTACRRWIVTMGDVPFVRPTTYRRLVDALALSDMAVLGFRPANKKRYGVLEVEGETVRRITEWKYWKDYPAERQAALKICNAGIYAVRREALLTHLPTLAARPQVVHKVVDGRVCAIEEYFITDLAAAMVEAGRRVIHLTTEDENETMGVDDPQALAAARALYRRRNRQ
jgi:bifunctional UDP-N-acetylglucosamine pyrophosphorylase/glucosamine-1-phosphate N-acetyltransferase